MKHIRWMLALALVALPLLGASCEINVDPDGHGDGVTDSLQDWLDQLQEELEGLFD